jgi:hypothetical protein
MTEKYSYETNIDVTNALRHDWRLPPAESANVINYKPLDVFNQEFLTMMNNRGVPIEWVLCFARPAWFQHKTAHIDVVESSRIECSALNIVIDGAYSDMRWYNMPDDVDIPRLINNLSTTPSGVPYIQFPLNGLREIYRAQIGFSLNLVRTDIPHAIFVKDRPRWCLSLRNRYVRNSWEESVQYLRDVDLLVE